ncbi:hypothetical protein 1 [Beihai sipunculid worm virus 3]|uniref:hypothetical protein 1 n=1 Tax=Beihai sipunculid worm virus 3 TaxID=1922675 RepID=UPI00090CBC05|nr:hypothetical protein 1 [Beihai sipunculid worm virus 3]APG78922.1 hypothetical protein 1 [Beihai sipunculid worm virus 3]
MNLFDFCGNNIESYNLGICFIVALCAFGVCELMWKSVLPSQSGKAERRELWNSKQKNKKNARIRKQKAHAAIEKRKEEAIKAKANHQQLNSQAGTQPAESSVLRLLRTLMIFFSFGSMSYLFNRLSFPVVLKWMEETGWDYIATLWNWTRRTGEFEDKEFALMSFIKESYAELKKIFSEFNIAIPDFKAFIPVFDFDVKTFDLIKRSKMCTDLCEIISMIVTIGWLSHFEFEMYGLTLFKTTSLRRTVSGIELIEAIYKYVTHMSKCFYDALTGTGISAFWKDAINSEYEDKFTYLTSTAALLECGRLELDDGTVIDPHEFDRILDEQIDTTLKLLDSCKHGEKSYYTPKLAALRKLKTQRILSQKRGIRAAPLGILLFGGSKVGKSVMCDVIMKYVLEVNGFDATPETIVSLNEFDKFQSEYRTHHNGVIFDDLANGKADQTEGNPLMKVIQFVNNNPCAALNPNLEMKGNVMIEPKVVIATTNVKDIQATTYSKEPVAIARRFPVTITQTVKPEFDDGNGMLDASKLSDTAIVDDFALFTVEKPVPRKGTISKSVDYEIYHHNGKPMENVGIADLLSFLRDVSKEHFGSQAQLLAKKEKLANCQLCEHECFPGMCSECTLDSQVGALPDFAECKEWLLELEERLCLFVEARLRRFWTTPMGSFILLALYKRNLRDVLMSDIKTIVGLIFAALWFDGSARFIVSTLAVYITYVWYSNRRYYQNVVTRLSTVPRPSYFIMNMSSFQKTIIISMFGGIAAFKILFMLIRKWREMPVPQAAAPIWLSDEGKAERHPSWGDSGHPERSAENNISVPENGMTMSRSQLVTIVGRKLCFITVEYDENTNTFCNALPVDTGFFLIPAHIVKSNRRRAKITRTKGNVVNASITKENTYRIPGTDLALWYVPEAGPQKNLVDLFPEDSNAFRHVDAEMLYNDHGSLRNFGKMNCVPGRVITSEGGVFKGLHYQFPGQTFEGLCLGVLVGSAPYTHIAGFHLAGKGSKGAAGVLTRGMVADAISELSKYSIVFKSHSASPLETTAFGTSFGPLKQPHEKSSVYAAPEEAKMQVYGDHTLPVGNQTSSVTTTLISEAVSEVMGIEKIHGRPYKMTSPSHWEVDLQAKTTTAHDFEDKYVAEAFEDYSRHVNSAISDADLAKVGKLPLDAVLAGIDGVDGVNAMNFATSSGFGLKGKKNVYVVKSDRHVDGITCPRDLDPLVLEEIEKMKTKLANGECINTIFKGSLKDEPTKLTKKKVRVFAACNIAFTILVREYFLTLTKLMLDHPETFECAVGVVAESPQWTDFMNHIYKYGKDRCVAGDYAAFDGRMSPKFMLLAFKLLIQLAERSGNYDADDLTIMRGIATEITNPLYDHHGTLVRFFGSNPSGHPMTVNINSLVNSLYMRYCYFALADKHYLFKSRIPPFASVVALMTYGDDNIMSVKKGHDYFNHTAIAGVLADAGIKYTMADKEAESVPFIHASETSFLKRAAVWDEELKLYRAPIELSSIAKTLHAHVESDVLTPEQHSAEAIRGVAEKFFEYGREVYEERVQQLEEVARRTGLVGYVGDLGSYDERLMRFRKKYNWQ